MKSLMCALRMVVQEWLVSLEIKYSLPQKQIHGNRFTDLFLYGSNVYSDIFNCLIEAMNFVCMHQQG